jgi:hypothetical protein
MKENNILYLGFMQLIIILLLFGIIIGIPSLMYVYIIDPMFPDDEIQFKQDIDSVYYHEINNYSVAFLSDNILVTKKVPNRPKVIVKRDATDHLWYECNFKQNFARTYGEGCVIHITGLNDIKTSGWNHGKFGSGMTTRLQ